MSRPWFVSPAEARAMRERLSGSAVATANPIRKPALSQLHSEPSNDAARRIEPARETLRAKVLEAIRRGIRFEIEDAGSGARGRVVYEGLTDEEGIALTGIPASTYRPRRVELVEANLVYDSKVTRPTRSGRKATVWIAR